VLYPNDDGGRSSLLSRECPGELFFDFPRDFGPTLTLDSVAFEWFHDKI
jgi:hypothetical protein